MNLLRRILQPTALLGLAALGARAGAQTQSFVQKTRTINAAVLLLDSDKPNGAVYGQTAAPFAFYNLDRATSTKPDGWVFTNPYAAGVVTDEMRTRYAELYNTTVNSPTLPVPAVGTHITKSEAPYWTVRLSQLSESQIANYNVLLVAPRYYLSLNTKERELLRRFVDGGGVLWVDAGSAGVYSGSSAFDPSNNLPFAIRPTNGGNAAVYSQGTSPLLSALRPVSDYDLSQINSLGATQNLRLAAVASGSSTGTIANNAGLVAEFNRFRAIASETNNGLPVIAQARMGDGAIVVTARGVASILNKGAANREIDVTPADAPGLANLGFQAAAPTLNSTAQAAGRFAVNLVTLGGEGLQPSGSPRKTSGAAAETPAPVLSRFSTERPAGSSDTGYGPGQAIGYGLTPNGPPVVYKGFLVATVGHRVVVVDAIPGRDLDGDGDPDDGISDANGNTDDTLRDVSFGKPLDVIWVSNDLGSDLSAPVCAEVPEAGVDGTGQSLVDQILVTDANNRLHAFTLNQSNATSRYRLVGGVHAELKIGSTTNYPLSAPNSPAGITSAVLTSHPIPPVVYDGVAYVSNNVTGNVGGVWAVDLSTATLASSTNAWYLGSTLNLPGPTAEPTIGYIPIADNSGGVDRVMYTPGRFNASNGQPGFASVWLGAKGEVPDNFSLNGGTLTVTTRAAAAGGIPIYIPVGTVSPVMAQFAPHITILDANGNPQTDTYITSGASNAGNGVLNFAFNSPTITTTEQFRAANLSIRIDYTIDWGFAPTSPSQQIVRGMLRLPIYKSTLGASVSDKFILGPIALTAHGTLHMVEAPPPGNAVNTGVGADSYFAIREDAGLRGQFRVISRYTLYKAYTERLGGSLAGLNIPAVLGDNDLIQTFLPGYTSSQTAPINTFTNFHYAGGVALRNGIAFTTINANRAGVIPVAMIAAFRAEPETAELRIGPGMPTTPWLQQTDWARSDANAVVRTPQTSTLSGNSVVADTDNGVIRIENLATVVNGEILDCLSESQPLGVGSSAQALTVREPDRQGDRWSPLLWFALWNGANATSTPFVGGNTAYLPATTALPDLLNSGTLNYSGVVWAIDADAPTSGLYATTLTNTNRPWITQQVQLIAGSSGVAGSVTASPYFRMPQTVGISSFDDFKARLNQTRLGSASSVNGLGGGDGIVTAFANTGFYGLSRADLVICDEGRLLQVDASGNPVVNTFGARFTGMGNGGSVANQLQLVRPVKSYPVGTSDTLVVDAASNRIMRLGGDGSVLRSVDRIHLDPTYKPTAYRVNEPLTFKDPRDATTFEGYVYKGAQEVVTAQQNVEYWIRYLVADSGNGRIVELADRFQVDSQGRVGAPIQINEPSDPALGVVGSNAPVAQVGVLVWQSPSLEGTANVGDYYNSISRVYLGTTTNGRYVYVAGVSRTRPTRVSAGLDNPQAAKSLPAAGGGAVVVFDPAGGTRVFDRFALPDLRNATFYNTTNGQFSTGTGSNVPSQLNRSFRGVQAVTAESVFVNNQASVRAMVTDLDAVYEFDLDARVLGNASADTSVDFSGNPLAPRWMINEAAFTALHATLNGTTYNVNDNPLSFRPTYARRLDSGEVILVNGYQGLMRDGVTAYTGEVTLLDGNGYDLTGATRNLGFTFDNVRLGLRTLTGIRGLVSPVFADRR